jgi:hypothetical protein
MKSRASRSKDSRKTSRQESSKSSSANNSASTSAKSDSTPSESSGSLHSPGSMTDNVSHTLQQKANQGASLDRRIATARIDRLVPPKP